MRDEKESRILRRAFFLCNKKGGDEKGGEHNEGRSTTGRRNTVTLAVVHHVIVGEGGENGRGGKKESYSYG